MFKFADFAVCLFCGVHLVTLGAGFLLVTVRDGCGGLTAVS